MRCWPWPRRKRRRRATRPRVADIVRDSTSPWQWQRARRSVIRRTAFAADQAHIAFGIAPDGGESEKGSGCIDAAEFSSTIEIRGRRIGAGKLRQVGPRFTETSECAQRLHPRRQPLLGKRAPRKAPFVLTERRQGFERRFPGGALAE